MGGLRRFLHVRLARTLYSPFGLAWLRARQSPDSSPDAFRGSPWPSRPGLIPVLRIVQRAWPTRRRPLGGASSAQALRFYPDDVGRAGIRITSALVSDGPVIRVTGQADARSMDTLLLAVARVHAQWPEAAWRFEVKTRPAWLSNALALSAPQARSASAAPSVCLEAPRDQAEARDFVARALDARKIPA